MAFERLRLRGLSGARDEFLLAATVQNLRRLAKLAPKAPPDETFSNRMNRVPATTSSKSRCCCPEPR
jgi:hypothetical protein